MITSVLGLLNLSPVSSVTHVTSQTFVLRIDTMTRESWRALCANKSQRQKDEIPKDWLVIDSQLPPANQLNVLEFPRDSGLLTATELRITDSHVETLLPKLASGEWSSVEVTRAFYKRAIIAHQVVSSRRAPEGLQCTSIN